jgi:hypothetical protein
VRAGGVNVTVTPVYLIIHLVRGEWSSKGIAMEYGRLIRDAWAITWRHRFLWFLGLFSGTSVGSCSVFGGNGFRIPSSPEVPARQPVTPPDVAQVMVQVQQWIASHVELVVAVIVAAVLVGLILIVISIIAQGGMTDATLAFGRGESITAGTAWRAGARFFWRFLGLYLVLLLAAILVALVVGMVVAAAIGSTSLLAPNTRAIVTGLWVILGVIVGLLFIPIAIAVSVVVAYAQRAIIDGNVGPIVGLRAAWLLARQHLSTSFVVWLVNLGLSLAANFAIFVALLLLAALLALVGLIFYLALGLGAVTIGYIVVATLVVFAALLLAIAIVNTFFWTYWSLAFQRLRSEEASSG